MALVVAGAVGALLSLKNIEDVSEMPPIFHRLTAYVKNLGLWRGLQLVTHRWIGRYLNPYANLVWGSLGEDALLWFYLTEVLSIRTPGYYVDVGCNHPINHSNTYRLYQLGWRGIAIDANKEVTEIYETFRPRDKVVTALISDSEEERDFFVFEGSTVSTVESQYVAAWESSNKIKEIKRLSPRTLSSILDEYGVAEEFELLKIDVEGHDAAVLRSLDLRRYKPKIILVEIHGETIESVTHSEIYQRLALHGYKMFSLAGYNGFFIKQ